MRKIFPLSFITASFFVAAQVLAHQGATGIVKERMDAFKASQTHLKSAVKAAKADNFDETQKLARLLADWGTKMPDFFPAGSDIMPSEAAPTIWSDMEGFKRAATQFADAANQLAAASAARNKEAVFASIKQGRCQLQILSPRLSPKIGLKIIPAWQGSGQFYPRHRLSASGFPARRGIVLARR